MDWLVQLGTLVVGCVLAALFFFSFASTNPQARREQAQKRNLRLDRRDHERVDRRQHRLGPPGGIERRKGPRRTGDALA